MQNKQYKVHKFTIRIFQNVGTDRSAFLVTAELKAVQEESDAGQIMAKYTIIKITVDVMCRDYYSCEQYSVL